VEANKTSPIHPVSQARRAFILLRRNQSGRRRMGSAIPAREGLPAVEVELVVTGIAPAPTTVIRYVPLGVVEEVVITSVPAIFEFGLLFS
jgi:hypothetical protein